jgi:sporulation protein YlmC with PRC-barrel domain
MLKVKKISEVIGKHVYTAEGEYFGQVEDVNLFDNRIDGWKVRVSGGFLHTLGGARGVIIPQQFVKSIGDVFIVTRGSLPTREEPMVASPGATNSASSDGGSMMMGSSASGFDSF